MLRLYDFMCRQCGHKFERCVIDDDNPPCEMCGEFTDRLMPLVRVNMGVGAYGYYDETLGKGIGTNKELKEEMQRQNVTKKGDTPKNGGSWI